MRLVKGVRSVNDIPVSISHLGSPSHSSPSAGICSNQGDLIHLAYMCTEHLKNVEPFFFLVVHHITEKRNRTVNDIQAEKRKGNKLGTIKLEKVRCQDVQYAGSIHSVSV